MKATAGLRGLVILAVLAASCAAPITHPVEIRDLGTPQAGRFSGVSIGLQAVADRRGEADRSLVGYRELGRGRERYATIPLEVAEAVTRALADRLGRMGARIQPAEGWDLSPEKMGSVGGDADYLVACEMLRLQCRGVKQMVGTRLQMETELVFYIGDRRGGQVVRRPVQVQIERFVAGFKPENIERLVNEALSEAMDRGLKSLE